jgi:hypothetical protein
MKKMGILLLAIVIVVGFVNVAEAENKIKKTKTVPLQTFINTVAGKTDKEIKAIFGEPSCQGHYIFLGMLYENFVKDERIGEILSVQVLFKIGVPVGTVKIRDGRRIIGSSDFKFVASSIRCRYYTFEVADANDPVVQNYSVYIRPWRATSLFPMNTQPIPSCEELNRENDRINQEIEKKRNTEKIEHDKVAPFQDAIERLIGKQTRGRLSAPSVVRSFWYPSETEHSGSSPNEQWMNFVTNEGVKYFLIPDSIKKNTYGSFYGSSKSEKFECSIREDRYKVGVDYLVFGCEIDCEKKRVYIGLRVYKTGRSAQDKPPQYETSEWESYADNSPIALIASKLKERSSKSMEIHNSKERKGEVITETQPLETKMKKTEQMPPNVQEKSASPVLDKKIVIVTWTFATIRSGADNNYPLVTNVKKGDKLTVIGEYGEWLNVRLEDGKEGWINNRVVK